MLTLALLPLLTTATPNTRVKEILDRFEAARPSETSLAFYSLDWSMSLAEAKARAEKEKRPILLILNTNITAGTNFFSGHT